MKAILVIDMPKSCAVCPIFQEGIDGYCPIGFLTPSNKYEIAKGCPLKPMPMKKASLEKWFAEGGTYLYTYNPNDYDKGWNDCVLFLEGEYDG